MLGVRAWAKLPVEPVRPPVMSIRALLAWAKVIAWSGLPALVAVTVTFRRPSPLGALWTLTFGRGSQGEAIGLVVNGAVLARWIVFTPSSIFAMM